MLKISGLVGAVAFVSVFLLSGAGSGLSIDTARADDCLAAPKTAAPSGQHWFYHVDRTTRRKCWYLHAGVQPRHHAAIRHRAAAETENTEPAPEAQTAAAPAAAPEPPAAAPAAPAPTNAADGAAPAPHVTVLAVRPSTPFVSTTVTPQQSMPEGAPTTPATQTLPRDQDAPAVGDTKPADTVDAQPQGKADAAFNAPAQTADAANEGARTRTAEMFLLLAFAFGAAAALIAIVSKLAGIYRRPRISDDPDAAWLSYRSAGERIDAEAISDQQDVPFVDPQEHYGLADLHAQEWLDRSTPPHRNADSSQAPSSGTDLNSIKPALRALQQARQGRVA